ncbi:Nif11-like leader peptide family natural product precursor [Gloeocapsopsis dulcis]|uniref:Nif11-like leader peptide family natural product n=1 Tax=Gloeocapsopsis dulcis AAB1 = 1H9 TaxID=1433147 RepID=A0A6N8FVT4_9CHRO|nr:Nif11-like leader peptide family natural product precursor [Gloeocapsopsis dulcis]MUL36884.1 Nif11-like leader peptide family natural product precursor [Gloeocapsopsis dulcis AAB1 = 1H9]WNN88698.1 Nif11-like leader peptide family natural product precursor [Gloeocapsopsis dulcis]
MAQETAAQFFKAVQQDNALQEKLKATSDPEAFIKIAAQQGYNFSVQDLDQAISKLSPEEFAAVINPGVSPRRHIVPR